MSGVLASDVSSLTEFLSTRPTIKVSRPSDSDFLVSSSTWKQTSARPLLVARPQSGDDVGALIGHLSSTGVPFAIRNGGHDLSGRSKIDGAVQIDMRELSHVTISADRKTAWVGGGVLQIDLLEALEKEGLMCAVPSTASVGWLGWAMLGGYGPFSSLFGLGCDQIVNARVVLADGNLVDADEQLLKGIRGAGPAFGAVVEIEIRVYPTSEVQGGVILYMSEDMESAISTFFDSWSSHRFRSDDLLPPQLYVQPMVFSLPEQGPAFFITFCWTGPADAEYQDCLSKITTFSPGGMPQVVPTTPAGYIRASSAMIPSAVYAGAAKTSTLRSLYPSHEAGKVIARHAPRIQPGNCLFSTHFYQKSVERLEQGSYSALPTSFSNREPHIMIEIIGYVTEGGDAKQGATWAKEFSKEIDSVPDAMPERYYSITEAEDLDLEVAYGKESLLELKTLKKRVDPDNIFCFAMPLAKHV